jgi:hypothetical protein
MPREKHPIHLVAKKAGQLNKVMLAIMKEERPSHDARRLISVFRQDLAKAVSQLNRLASRELAVYRNTNSVSWSSLYVMQESFRTLGNSFERLQGPEFMQGGKPPKMSRSQERLGELIRELRGAINALEVAMERRRVPVHQGNFFLKDFEEVRKAWAGLVKKSEAGPTVAEGERAIGLVGEVDLQDSKMMKRFVNLIRALRITQEFQMRYRSKAPGRPWVYMATLAVFPDPDTVQAIRDRDEWDGAISIAATQPTWRIVWQFD